MYAAVSTALHAAPESLGLAALPAKRQLLVAKIAQIHALAVDQSQGTRGKTARRDELMQTMVDLALDVASAIGAYASTERLTELGKSLHASPRMFARLRIPERPALTQGIHDAAQPVAEELVPYGVTPEMLAELQAQIGLVRAWLDQPRAAIRARAAVTAQLAEAFRETDALLEEQIDRMVFVVRKTHPEFYADYRRARDVIATRGRQAKAEPEPLAAAPTLVNAPAAASAPIATPLAKAA